LLAGVAVLVMTAPVLGQASGWSVVPSPNARPVFGGSTLFGVSCVAATACIAAGRYANSSGVDRALIESN
jgi:hypothetical protein